LRKSNERAVARGALSAQALADLEPQAAKAAALLRQLANEHRLLLLCHLMLEGEVTVGHLAERLSLSQPALSQHLMRLREDGLVATRREGTTIHYRIADPRVVRLLGLMHEMFCPRL
jgi:ArsR family transcriptional regulator, virulence genes transcriptional regulator